MHLHELYIVEVHGHGVGIVNPAFRVHYHGLGRIRMMGEI